MTEEQKSGSGLLGELQALGQQLSTAVMAMWESEESRDLRQEIGEGFVELGRQVDSALKSAQESEAAQQFSEQLKETVDRARDSELAAELEQGLITGLHELNRGLAKFVSSMEASPSTQDEPEAGPETETEPEA